MTTSTATYTREDVAVDSHGVPLATWLYRPDGIDAPAIIVMAHGFGAVRAMRLDAYVKDHENSPGVIT